MKYSIICLSVPEETKEWRMYRVFHSGLQWMFINRIVKEV